MDDKKTLTRSIEALAAQELGRIIETRRHLHMHPCLSYHEKESYDYLCAELDREGIAHSRCADYGIVARIKGTEDGPCIAFRADFDALPIEEMVESEYKSQNPGVMHACGHDGHASVLMGLARSMQRHRELIRGEAVFIFQYAEELPPGGALSMIEAGCLKGVDKIYGMHVSDELDTGVVGICPGKYMAASDSFFVDITGGGGHGSRPSEAADTVSAAAEAIGAINHIVSRFVPPDRQMVISTCRIHGGETYNIIPGKVSFAGTVRSYEKECAELARVKIEDAVRAACSLFGTEYSYDFQYGYPAVVNDALCSETVKKAAADFGLSLKNIPPTPVGEDFSRYLEKRPGAFFRVGIRNSAIGAVYPLHHELFSMDERGLETGFKMFWGIYLRETGQM